MSTACAMRAGGIGDLGEQVVRVGQPAGHRDGVLVGEQQPVDGRGR